MLRQSSSVGRVLTYATFFALSLAIHMLVILGDRHDSAPIAPPPSQATSTGVDAGSRR